MISSKDLDYYRGKRAGGEDEHAWRARTHENARFRRVKAVLDDRKPSDAAANIEFATKLTSDVLNLGINDDRKLSPEDALKFGVMYNHELQPEQIVEARAYVMSVLGADF